jgi:hypothetical protein
MSERKKLLSPFIYVMALAFPLICGFMMVKTGHPNTVFNLFNVEIYALFTSVLRTIYLCIEDRAAPAGAPYSYIRKAIIYTPKTLFALGASFLLGFSFSWILRVMR